MATNDVYLNCGYVNIQSIGNKTLQIRELLNEKGFDILALSETWLNSADSSRITEMTPPTHSFYHIPREDGRGEG